MHHIDAVIDALQAEPHRGLVVSFLYEGPRPEGDSSVLVQFSALVPVLEAWVMYLKAKRARRSPRTAASATRTPCSTCMGRSCS